MMPRPPLPDDEPTETSEIPDLGREDDLERSLGETEPERSMPPEEGRPIDQGVREGSSARPPVARDGTPTAAYTCQGCGATFATRRELHLHNEETHGGGSTGGSTDEPPGGVV